MRANITFKFEKPLVLPIQYNHIMQAVVLKWLNDEEYAKKLHDEGFEYNNRVFKLYTFSKLTGDSEYNREYKRLTFKTHANITVSAMDEKFLNYVVNTAIINDKISIMENEVYVDSVRCSNIDAPEAGVYYTLSPVVTYSTFEHDGKKKTYYYNPMEHEFSELIRENLIKKYIAYTGQEPCNKDFSIEPVNCNRLKENIVIYKGTVIKGWSGEFKISGSPELIYVAYNAGIGSKNSQGFGCIEVKRKG